MRYNFFCAFMLLLIGCASPIDTSALEMDLNSCTAAVSKSGNKKIILPLKREETVYMMSLIVGQKPMSAVVDTGSADIVLAGYKKLFDPELDLSGATGKKKYGVWLPTEEATNGLLASRISYISGDAKLQKYGDQLNFTCGDTVKENADFNVIAQNNGIKSILGLGFKAISASKSVKTFMELLVDRGYDDEFSLALCGTKSGSKIAIGGKFSGLSENDIQWTPITSKSHFVVGAIAVSVQGYGYNKANGAWEKTKVPGALTELGVLPTFNEEAGRGIKTAFDSGATATHLPYEIYAQIKAIMKTINNSLQDPLVDEFWDTNPGKPPHYAIDIPQTTVNEFPNFVFTLPGGAQIIVHPDNYLKPFNKQKRTFVFKPAAGIVLLGQSVLESAIFIFDRANGQIGVSDNSAHCQ